LNLTHFIQVDFLNSVIVDMQRKNDELKGKMDLLESAGVFDAIDINDLIMMNGVDRGKVAPRLFCDICDR
jgi:CAP-Gly domain-containing linker protein 1